MAGQELRGDAWAGKQEKIMEMGGKAYQERSCRKGNRASVGLNFVSTPNSKMSCMFKGDRAKEPRGQWGHNGDTVTQNTGIAGKIQTDHSSLTASGFIVLRKSFCLMPSISV